VTRRGRRLAVAGAGLSLATAGVLAVGVLRDDDRGPGEADVFDLRAGDCFDDPPQDEELATVAAVPCGEPHDAEVYAVFDTAAADGDGFPGQAALTREAEQGCFERFQPFVGVAPESTSLAVHFLLPTRLSWDNAGDRAITCVVVDPAGPTTGSLEGAAGSAAAAASRRPAVPGAAR
jgi:hypothetical protein